MTDTLTLPRFDAVNAHGELTFSAQAAGILAYIEAVAGTEAQPGGVVRRLRKGTEELGEVSEAFLNLTGQNGKNKVPADLLEETVDVFIVAADTLLEYLRSLAAEPALEAICRAETRRLKNAALSCLRTAVVPGEASTHDDGFWVSSNALLEARKCFRKVSASPTDWDVRRAAGDAFVDSFYTSLELMYTYVEGLPQTQPEFDKLLISMLERKLTKWVTAMSRGSNAVQQA